MQFENFSVKNFNLFGPGQDDLPHLICACLNKQFARAIQSLLSIGKNVQTLPSRRTLRISLVGNGAWSLVVTKDGESLGPKSQKSDIQ